MTLYFRDRVRIAVLAAMVAAGFVMVGARRLGWPRSVEIPAMIPVMGAIVGLLARWVRSAEDFDGSGQ